MAGPAWGPAFVQGQAAGFQGQNLGIEQLLQQLRVAAAQKQFQDAEEAKQAQGGGYAAILSMLGGAGAPPAALPVSPAPGTNSATAPRAAALPPAATAMPTGTGEQMDVGAPAGGAGAAPIDAPQMLPGSASPARQVLEGRPQVTAPQMAAPGSMGLPQLIQAVERSMPGAPPQVKMLALEKLSGVMNEQAKVEFARMEHMFKMNMEIARLTELAQNHFQMSLDRNASVAQRADAAREHQQTMLALGQLTAAVRREAETGRGERAALTDDTRRRGQDLTFNARQGLIDLRRELGQGRLDLDEKKLQQTEWWRQGLLDLKDRGLSQRVAEMEMRERVAEMRDTTTQRGQDITADVRREAETGRNTRAADRNDLEAEKEEGRNARAAGHDQTRLTIAGQSAALRERLAGLGKLTPEQQLLRNQSNQLARQYGAVVAAAGANSKQAKLLESQLQALNQRIEGTLQTTQPGATAPQQPVQPTPQTTPLPPQKGDVRVWEGNSWRFKGGDPADRANWEPAK